jgi:hypothetical protein
MGTEEDKRLERLYDYTKFHIGIYTARGHGCGKWKRKKPL